jgi:hypothetical protein
MARELARPLRVEDVQPTAAHAFAEVFGLELAEPPRDAQGLWPAPLQAADAARGEPSLA